LKFFEVFTALFPRSKAFQLFIDNNKRKLVKGLSVLPDKIRQEAESVYSDIFPHSTRYPEKWEDVFGIIFTAREIKKRRNILDSLWKINKGGQSPMFLEEILQKIDDTIHIFENIPIRNPRDSNVICPMCCDNMICDNEKAVCDYVEGDVNFRPTILMNDTSEVYDIPNKSDFWETCFFVCKSVNRGKNNEINYIQKLNIDKIWKNYIEYLILKIKPIHTTAVIFINWL